jgi:hypothetical protein
VRCCLVMAQDFLNGQKSVSSLLMVKYHMSKRMTVHLKLIPQCEIECILKVAPCNS